MGNRTEKIKNFWDDRAKEHGENWQATLGEDCLRKLEIRTLIKLIIKYKPTCLLDIGCGNGYSTKIYAKFFPTIQFIGIDYSEQMIQNANMKPVANCKFYVGDVLNYDSLPQGNYDLIITQRCLQNIPDYKSQRIAISNLLRKKSPQGALLLMECSKDGVDQVNKLRVKLGKKPIEGIEPWHNNFFVDNNIVNDFGATIEHFTSTYMFVSRILTSYWLIARVFNLYNYLVKFASYLPAVGKFGYDKLYIIK